MLHWNVEPASVEVKVNVETLELLFAGGPLVMVVSGRTVSMVHVYEAGVASTLPAGSMARTWKVCEPSASAPVANAEVQALNAEPSTLHWKVEPACVAVKENEDVAEFEMSGGCAVMVVSGGIVSTVHV